MADWQEIDRDTCWKAADASLMVWAEFGDDCVLFHRPSGKTHFVNQTTRELLSAMQHRSMTTAQIALAYGAEGGSVADAAADEQITATLLRFEALGLLRRA